MEVIEKKRAIALFWLASFAFFAISLGVMIQKGIETGHGIGIGDGRVNAGGQKFVDGRLDGVRAARNSGVYER